MHHNSGYCSVAATVGFIRSFAIGSSTTITYTNPVANRFTTADAVAVAIPITHTFRFTFAVSKPRACSGSRF